jgi:hypothetical protein
MKRHLLTAALLIFGLTGFVQAQNMPPTPSTPNPPSDTPSTPPTFPKTETQTPEKVPDQNAPAPSKGDEDYPSQSKPDQSPTNPGSVSNPGNSQSTTGAQGTAAANAEAKGTAEIQPEIQTSLREQGLAGVTATVTDKEIELTGIVPSSTEKKAANDIASAYADGRKVVDHIKINK